MGAAGEAGLPPSHGSKDWALCPVFPLLSKRWQGGRRLGEIYDLMGKARPGIRLPAFFSQGKPEARPRAACLLR